MRTGALRLAFAGILLAACGGGDAPDPIGPVAKTLTLTLQGLPSPVDSGAIVTVSGQVSGTATLDSVVVRYAGQRQKTLEGTFSLQFEAAWPCTAARAEATAWSVQAPGPAAAYRTHEVLGGPIPALVGEMLLGLPAYIEQEKAELQSLLPRNPHLATQIQAKLAELGNPALADDIVCQKRYRQAEAASAFGAIIPTGVVFMSEPMRGEARETQDFVGSTLGLLETFLGIPFPAPAIRGWYGFTMGMRGGGGFWVEDRGTYEARLTGTMAPYNAIMAHEQAHSYIGHESLTQFLELYVYNQKLGRPATVEDWVWTRSYDPLRTDNTQVHAVLDIYRLIGVDAMRRAYQRLHALQPPYGQLLSAEAQAIFVDEAPEAVKSQVAAAAARIGY